MKQTTLRNSLLTLLFIIGFGFNSKAMFYDLIVNNTSGCTLNFSTFDNGGNQIGITFVSISGGTTNVCINTGAAVPYTVVVDNGAGGCSTTLGYGVWPTGAYFAWSWGGLGCLGCSSGTWNTWTTPNPVCGGTGMTISFII